MNHHVKRKEGIRSKFCLPNRAENLTSFWLLPYGVTYWSALVSGVTSERTGICTKDLKDNLFLVTSKYNKTRIREPCHGSVGQRCVFKINSGMHLTNFIIESYFPRSPTYNYSPNQLDNHAYDGAVKNLPKRIKVVRTIVAINGYNQFHLALKTSDSPKAVSWS